MSLTAAVVLNVYVSGVSGFVSSGLTVDRECAMKNVSVSGKVWLKT